MRFAVKLLILVLAGDLQVRTARAAVDLTGDYLLRVSGFAGPFTALYTFEQSGTQLTVTWVASDPEADPPPAGPYTGTIDPDAGTFHIPLPDGRGGLGFPGCTGNRFDGTATPDGQTLAGRLVQYYLAGLGRCVDVGGPFIGGRVGSNPCGNGLPDAGEECDDGNRVDDDCCSSQCRRAPAGTACTDDGNVCTDDACDDSGVCRHPDNRAPCGTTCRPATCSAGFCLAGATPVGAACDDGDACTTADACNSAGVCKGTPLVCDICETCVAPGVCVTEPAATCAALGGQAAVRLDLARRTFLLTAKGRAAVHFRPAVVGTDYAVCVFSSDGAAWNRLLAARVSGGGVCEGMPCWKSTHTGFTYRNPARTPEGLSELTLRATGPRAGATARGGGPGLQVPGQLPAGIASVRVQLSARDLFGTACYATDLPNIAAHSPLLLRAGHAPFGPQIRR